MVFNVFNFIDYLYMNEDKYSYWSNCYDGVGMLFKFYFGYSDNEILKLLSQTIKGDHYYPSWGNIFNSQSETVKCVLKTLESLGLNRDLLLTLSKAKDISAIKEILLSV